MLSQLKLSIFVYGFLYLVINHTETEPSSIILYQKTRDYIEHDTVFHKKLKRLMRNDTISGGFKLNTSVMIRRNLQTTLNDNRTIFIDPRIDSLNNDGRDVSKYRIYFTLPLEDTLRFVVMKAPFNENKKILFIENLARIEGFVVINEDEVKKIDYQFKYPDREEQIIRSVYRYNKKEILDLVKWINYYNLDLSNDSLVYDLGQLKYSYKKEYGKGLPSNYNPEIKYYLSEYMLDNGVNVSFIYIKDKDKERLYAYTYSGLRYGQYFYFLSSNKPFQIYEFEKKILEENFESRLESKEELLKKIFNNNKGMLELYKR